MFDILLAYLPLWGIYSAAAASFAGLGALAYFVPFLRKDAIYVALALVGALYVFNLGDSIGAKRVQAKWNAESNRVEQTVDRATTDAARDAASGVRNDPFDAATGRSKQGKPVQGSGKANPVRQR